MLAIQSPAAVVCGDFRGKGWPQPSRNLPIGCQGPSPLGNRRTWYFMQIIIIRAIIMIMTLIVMILSTCPRQPPVVRLQKQGKTQVPPPDQQRPPF